jgi:hypothetical protein
MLLPEIKRDRVLWTAEEEAALRAAVAANGHDWAAVRAAADEALHPKRTRADCKIKWRLLRLKDEADGVAPAEEEEGEDDVDEEEEAAAAAEQADADADADAGAAEPVVEGAAGDSGAAPAVEPAPMDAQE